MTETGPRFTTVTTLMRAPPRVAALILSAGGAKIATKTGMLSPDHEDPHERGTSPLLL